MLASITPLGERGRNQRWGVTIAAFVVGSVAGGTLMGALLGWLGSLTLGGRSTGFRLVLLGALLAVGAGFDLRVGGLRLPTTQRQVNEDWLTRYRGWVYGVAFGFQLGTGVLTIVTTAAVYATLGAALLAGNALLGALVGAAFGLARAVPILLAGRIRRADELMRFHRRVRELDRPARRAVLAAQAALAVAAFGLWMVVA